MKTRRAAPVIVGLFFCLSTLALAPQEEAPKPSEKVAPLFLPQAMSGLKMGMSAKEIQDVRENAADFFGNLKEKPKDAKTLCAFFKIQNDPTAMDITYYCKGNGLNSIYISFEYRGDESTRDQELAYLKTALTEGLGEPSSPGNSSFSWDKPGLFYSVSSGIAGADGYWFAYQIDRK